MRRFYLMGFLLLLLFDTLGQVNFKLTAIDAQPLEVNIAWVMRIFSHPWMYIVIVSYIGAFITWMVLLKKVPIGPAFAASHLQVITVMLASVWLFKEEITLFRVLGALLIILGILSLALAERQIQLSKLNKKSTLYSNEK